MSSTKKTIACFGATGGCVGAALACALKAGHHCTALARTPEKLRTLLSNEHHVPIGAIDQYLTITQGDVKDPAAVSKALVSPLNSEAVVDVILSGLGAYPTFQWSLRRPFPLTDPTICETAIRTIFAALQGLLSLSSAATKPLLVVISTAGCGRRRGIPLPVYLPYHYFLGGPLADKKRMEEVVVADRGEHVRDFVVMRPLLLTDGEARGDGGLRVGWEWGAAAEDRTGRNGQVVEMEPGPAVGYYVGRRDLGTWTFEKVIVEGGWEGKCVYLTY